LIRWFIGWDKDEGIASYVLEHSLQTRTSIPIAFTHLNRDALRGIFKRERSELDSTDFSSSRFLVPYLCNYEGWAIFSDCDMVVVDDPAKLWAWRDDRYAVRVVKRDHVPKEEVKFLGHAQLKYSRKNWSSLMLINNAECKALTLDYVHHAPGLDLHQFKWLEDPLVGDLPAHWNHLVGADTSANPSLIHYTSGGCWFQDYQDCEFNQEWFRELMNMQKIKE